MGIFTRGFHHHASFSLLESKMRALKPALSEEALLRMLSNNALSLLENAKNHKFFALCQPRLPESATKVAVSIRRVNYTWGNAVHSHLALPYSCTFIFWVPFWPNFHFFHIFWRQVGTFITTKGSNSAFRALRRFSRALQLLFQNFPPSFPGFFEH